MNEEKVEITLEEATQDYLDNERDIQMFELMLDGKWKHVTAPAVYLQDALAMRDNIAKVIKKRGGTIPLTDKQKQSARIAELQSENQALHKKLDALMYSYD